MSGLTEEAKLILKETVFSPFRNVMRAPNPMNGTVQLIVNKKDLIGESNGRDITVWEAALEELVTQGLLKKTAAPTSQTFKVTKKGDERAESLGL